MKRTITAANAALEFTLEMAMLAALIYRGIETDGHLLIKIALAVGAPAVAVVVWWAFLRIHRRDLSRGMQFCHKARVEIAFDTGAPLASMGAPSRTGRA